MKKIIIKRAKLEYWIESLDFKEAMKNVFVRFSLGNTYRLGEIVDF